MRRVVKWLVHAVVARAELIVDFHIQPELPLRTKLSFLFGRYEPETSNYMRQLTGEVAFDVGAHIGYYSRLLSRRFKTVYAFEPDERNFAFLKRNTRGCKNIIPVHAALSNTTGSVAFFSVKGSTFRHSLIDEGNTTRSTVPTFTMDDFVKKNNIATVSFVKIDVEGAEDAVLKGMREVIARDNPIIIAEKPVGSRYVPISEPIGAHKTVQNFIINSGR